MSNTVRLNTGAWPARISEKNQQTVQTTFVLNGLYFDKDIPVPDRHQSSIFGTIELNFRVRHGNGWTLNVINTNYSFMCRS